MPRHPHDRPAHGSSLTGSRDANSTLLEKLTLLLTDFGLLAALFAVPLLLGGRHPFGQLVLTAVACWVAIAWALHQIVRKQPTWTWTRAEPVLLAAIALGVMHATVLPAGFVNLLSPNASNVLTAWNSETAAGVGEWSYISFTPAASELGLLNLLAYVLLFVVAAQRIRDVGDAERFLKWICVAVTVVATFGLVQRFTTNGKFFWFYEHPFSSTLWNVKGSFANRNHFAHFLALGVGPLLWWIIRCLQSHRSSRGDGFGARRTGAGRRDLAVGLLFVALSVLVTAGLLSKSRGGTLAIFVAAAVCVGLLYQRRCVSGRLLSLLTGISVLVGCALSIFGYQAVSDRLEDFEISGRLRIWETNLRMFADFPLAGTGVGSHAEAYPMYLDEPFENKEYSHAESGYLQVASETGMLGLAAVLAAVGTCGYWCLRGISLSRADRVTIALAAVCASLVVNAAHALVDFIWYVPGCMVMVCVLAACACRLYQLARDSHAEADAAGPTGVTGVPRVAWIGSCVGIAALGSWMIEARLPAVAAESHWNEYLKLTFRDDRRGDAIDEAENDSADRLRKKIESLQATVHADPNHARAELRLTMGYLAYFHYLQKSSTNPMSVSQIRDAAWASGFESPGALREWLERAIGDNLKYLDSASTHARRAAELSPLQGEAYLYLAELSFLNGSGPNALPVLLEQARRVRPYSAQVLFVAGRESWTTGDSQRAIEYWRGAFHRSVAYQQRIINILAPALQAEFIVQHLEPDLDALERLESAFARLKRSKEHETILRLLAERSANQAEKLQGNDVIANWLRAGDAYKKLGESDDARRCLEAAVKSDPNSYEARLALGTWLFEGKHYADAAPHITWCLRRRPHVRNVKLMAEVAAKEGLRMTESAPTQNRKL